MSHTNEDNTVPEPAGRNRQGHRRHRPKPAISMGEVTLPHEKRRSHWRRQDSVMLLVALVELGFLPFALKTLIIPVAKRGLGFETAPFGLILMCYLAGTLLAFILFVLLCYLIRKHIYRAALLIMIAVAALELASHPLAQWASKFNQQNSRTGGKSVQTNPAPK